MKRQLAALAAFVAIATGPAVAAPRPAQITVTGTGSVAEIPDQATVNATVITNAATAADAVDANNRIYDRVVQAVQSAGVARTDITLSYYNMEYVPKPQAMPVNPDQRYGYTVNRSFAIKVRAIAKAGAVVDAATAVESTTIGGVSFGLADSSKAMKTATTRAVADARSKAEVLAAAAGLHILGIARISQGGGGGVQPMMRMAVMAAPAPTTFDSGNVNVSADVTIVYLASP
jgi:uncharacterized protein YggE